MLNPLYYRLQVAGVIGWTKKNPRQTTANNIIKANSGQYNKNRRQFMLSERTECEFMDKQASAFSPLHILGIRLHFICREFYGSKAHSLKTEKREEKNQMIVTQKPPSAPPSCLSFNFIEEFSDKDAFFLLWKRKGSGGKTHRSTRAPCKSLSAAPGKQLSL